MLALSGFWSWNGLFKILLSNRNNGKSTVIYQGRNQGEAQVVWSGIASVLEVNSSFQRAWESPGHPTSMQENYADTDSSSDE